MDLTRLPLQMWTLKTLLYRAIKEYRHNVIIIWGELGEGKTSLMLQAMFDIIKDWPKVLSFELEPHICLSCGVEWNAKRPYTYELICPECSKTARVSTSFREAMEAAKANWWVDPFPVDRKTGYYKQFPEGQKFTLCKGKGRGRITKLEPYLNFSFNEMKGTIENAVFSRLRIPVLGWDDVAVYFHRSNIQYMHPEVKTFFSRYSFVRQYVSNVLITVPTIEFVPEQLALFCTADILLQERGRGDFDTKKQVRSFFGKTKTWTKSYDGRDSEWSKLPDEWMDAYEEIRHAHAVEAFEKPEEIFVTTMPQTKDFGTEPSLLDGSS